jgi:hypothetical protein
MAARIETFSEFWLYYVNEHRKPETRWLHFFGTSMAITTLISAIATRHGSWVPLALVCGYGPAWVSHFFIEKNRPATFKYPFFSLAADFVMFAHMIRGTMDAEVARAAASARLQPVTQG